MKQYKLIKEYPGSPKLEYIAWCEDVTKGQLTGALKCSSNWKGTTFYNAHPEFWELIVENDYEILSFLDGQQQLLGNKFGTEKTCLELGYKIHSAKRLSDGLILTIGDTCYLTEYPNQEKFEIEKFEIDEHGILIIIDTNNPVSYIESVTKVEKKDYEILSFLNTDNINIYTFGGISWNTDKYGLGSRTYEYCLKYYKIHSIKRLSDGEIFTVGDDILEQKEHSKIERFELRGNNLAIRINHQITKGSSTIMIGYSEFKRYIPKTPLFKTEDGVDIFEGDIYSIVDQNLMVNHNCKTHSSSGIKTGTLSGCKYFSTKEATEEYIIMNKPCLFIAEILNFGINGWTLGDKERLKKLVKSKL